MQICPKDAYMLICRRSYAKPTPSDKLSMAIIIVADHEALDAPLPGSSFATLAVALPVARKQLAVPQLYPLGQQPAVAADDGHSVQPPAQVASLVTVAAADASLAGTTIVTPSDTIVVDAVIGHEVNWQSRPVWQQPPP